MRNILLASVAAIPLLSIAALPAPAQQLKEKGGSSISQSQGGGEVRDKGAAQGRIGQNRPNAGGEGGAMNHPQAKTEGRASGAGGGEEHTTLGQDTSKGKSGEKNASDSKSHASDSKSQAENKSQTSDQPKANLGRDAAKTSDRGKAKSIDQAKDQSNGKAAADQSKNKNQGQADAKDKNQNQAGAKVGANPGKGNQATGTNSAQKQAPTTTGQAPRSNEPNARIEQNGRNDDLKTREGQNGREPQNQRDVRTGASEQGGAQHGADARGNVTLTDEQRTKIRQTVLTGRDVPRVDRVNFDIEVGRPVPREVRIREVPSTLVEIYPEWRGDEYFVVNDEIVIVDRSRRIVSRVPVSASSASIETHRGSSANSGSSTSVEVTYTPEEIRRVQEVLIEKGFYKGRADGVMSVEFKDALISFQRREGIEATGRIDQRTATSLGVSIRTEGQAGGREDGNRSDQQGARDNDQKTGQNNPNRNDKPNDKPATSGQGGNAPSGSQKNPSDAEKGAQRPGLANDPSQKSNDAPSGETRQRPEDRPSTSGQGGPSRSGNSDVSPQGGASKPNASQPAGREGANEQRRRP